MASRRLSPPAGGTARSVRRLARPLQRKRLKKAKDVVECLEKTLPDINLELSQNKSNKNPFDFKVLMKEVNDLRDKHGTSKKEDCRADVLSRVPASLLRDTNADGTTNPPGPNWAVFIDKNDTAAGIIYAETETEANEFRRRGFHEFREKRVFHRGAAHSSFPWPAEPAAAEPAAAAAAAAMPLPGDDDDDMPLPDDDELELHERPPPEKTHTPYDYIPEIRKNGCGSEREKWIECFEEKVVCERMNFVYSPIRLWERKEYAKKSTLNVRLLQYYFAKQNLSTGGEKETQVHVKKVARDHAREKYGGNKEFTSGNGDLKYFDICLHLYEESRGSSAGN